MTSSVLILSRPAVIASSEPCTSDLITTGSSPVSPLLSCENISSSVPRAPVAMTCAWSRRLRWRYSVISRARFSLSTATKRSPDRHPVEAQDLDQHRRPGRLDRLATVVEQRARPAPLGAGHDDVADPQRAALHQHRRHHAAAPVELGLDDRAVRLAVRVGPEIEQLGLELHRLDQLVEVGALDGAHRHRQDVAAELLEHDVVAQELLLHPVGIGVRPVDLVDRHDHRHSGGLGVADRLDGLRHHAVVGRHHQDDDVGHRGAAGAHRREGGVARGVDEGDRPAEPMSTW